MADEDRIDGSEQDQQQDTAGTPAAAENTDTPDRDPSQWIPKARFDEVNRQLKDLRTKAETAQKQAAQAEEERLAKQQEWQQLAEQRQARIAELEPGAEMATELATLINEQIAAEIKGWPEEVTALRPETDDPRAMLAWVQQARPLAERLNQPPAPAGNSAGPKPANGAVADQKRIEQWRREAQTRVRNQL